MGNTPRTPLATEPKKKARRGPNLREASLQDYDQIASLESRYDIPMKSYEQWAYLHLNNPLQPERHPGWPIGWVIEDENKQIVGFIGNTLLPYEFEARRILAVSGYGFVAETSHRSASLLLLDRLINQPDVELFLANTITTASAPIFSAFECSRVPVGVWDEFAFWITHYQGFSERFLAKKHCPLAQLLSYPLSAAVFLKDRLTKKALREGDVEVQVCPGFDDRFDGFWEDLKKNNPHLLLAVRTRAVLEWHFKYGLLKNQVWIATVVDGPRLAAYAIFDRRDLKYGFKRMRLVDFQSLEGGTALLSPLLSWALRKCREEGIHMLVNVGRWLEEGELIETVAPYRRKLPTSWAYFYRANHPGLAERLRDRRAWAPSLFDGNASL